MEHVGMKCLMKCGVIGREKTQSSLLGPRQSDVWLIRVLFARKTRALKRNGYLLRERKQLRRGMDLRQKNTGMRKDAESG